MRRAPKVLEENTRRTEVGVLILQPAEGGEPESLGLLDAESASDAVHPRALCEIECVASGREEGGRGSN